MTRNLPCLEPANTLESEPIKSSHIRGLRVNSIGTGACCPSLVAQEGAYLRSQTFWRPEDKTSKSRGEKKRATASMAVRDVIPPSSDASMEEEGGQLNRRVFI